MLRMMRWRMIMLRMMMMNDEDEEDEDDKMRWRMVMVSWPNLCTRCLSKVFWQDLFMRSL